MSYVSKTYEFVQKLQALFNKKLFNTAFIAIGSMILFFGVMNVYAAGDTSTTAVEPDWKGIKTYCNVTSSAEADENNSVSSICQSDTSQLWSLVAVAAPDITTGGANLDGESVPGDMKNGLLGITDQAIEFAYDSSLNVDVIAHLQEEWIPGYSESNTSVFADDGTVVAVPGYDSLMSSGIAPLWNKMRDIAYVLLVVIMVVIGFMIMFRSKIGGQTLVSIGNTIPSVIISLVLITFSFAIAGLVIDVGGFVVNVMSSLFNDNAVSTSNIGQLMMVLFRGLDAERITENITSSITSGPMGSVTAIVGFFSGGLIGLVGIVILLIAIGVVFVGAIKVLIVLYKAYFGILLNVILGPLQIMLGTLPGQEGVRLNWFFGIVRNVLVFPIVFFIINIPIYLSNAGNMQMDFPSKLTGAAAIGAANDGATIGINSGILGLLFMFIFRVFVLYYACQAPKFAEAIIPPVQTNSSRAAADAMAGAKMGLSKIPLLGGMFK